MSPERLPRFLLCWGYHRAGWIQPFEELRDRMDISYLFLRHAEDEEGCLTDAPRYYWSDFANAREVLEALHPDGIVFMALDGAWSIALNAVARRHRIPTFIVQHGHVESADDGDRVTTAAALSRGSPVPAVRFAASSLGIRGASTMVRLLRFMVDARLHGSQAAMSRHRFLARMPDHYVALSPESAQAIYRLDNPSPSRISCIGLPEYDLIFREVSLEVPDDGPVLLLDSPNAENRWGVTTTTTLEKAAFLWSMSGAASGLGRKLRVKLHPESYGADWLPELPNATYLRDASLPAELNAASLCIAFDSTLAIAAVWLRPTVLVRLRPSRIVDVAAETSAALVVASMADIDPTTLRGCSEAFRDSLPHREEFVFRLAHKVDGRAVERLGDLLTYHTNLDTALK